VKYIPLSEAFGQHLSDGLPYQRMRPANFLELGFRDSDIDEFSTRPNGSRPRFRRIKKRHFTDAMAVIPYRDGLSVGIYVSLTDDDEIDIVVSTTLNNEVGSGGDAVQGSNVGNFGSQGFIVFDDLLVLQSGDQTPPTTCTLEAADHGVARGGAIMSGIIARARPGRVGKFAEKGAQHGGA
jgi:hypothetical protein